MKILRMGLIFAKEFSEMEDNIKKLSDSKAIYVNHSLIKLFPWILTFDGEAFNYNLLLWIACKVCLLVPIASQQTKIKCKHIYKKGRYVGMFVNKINKTSTSI